MTVEYDSRPRLPEREWRRSGTPKPLKRLNIFIPVPGFPPDASGRYKLLFLNNYFGVPGFPYTKYIRALREGARSLSYLERESAPLDLLRLRPSRPASAR